MKVKHSSLFLLCLVISLQIYLSKGDDDDYDDEDRPRSCQKYIFDWVYGITKSALKCLGGSSTFKVKSIFEYSTRASCLFKCVLQEEGIVDLESGRLDDIGSALYFEKSFAEAVREISLPVLQRCFAMADDFQPEEYWCRSYLPFTECSFQGILKGLIPYGGDCVTYPLLGLLFSTVKYLAPESPAVAEEMEELRRSIVNKTRIKCMDKDCNKMYEYKKVNGTQTIVMYNKDMEVIESRPAKSNKTAKTTNANTSFGNYNYNFNNSYSSNYKYKYQYP